MTREEAIEIVQAVKFIDDFEDYSDRLEIALDMAIEALKEKRPHGEWKMDSEYGFIFHCSCSECNSDVMKYISGSENWWLNSTPNFCPNCGSDNRKRGRVNESKDKSKRI